MLKFGAKKWVAFVVSMLLLTDLTIVFDIPFQRQIFGFIFLTIISGLLILQILKLNKIDFLEKFILSWGLSISFLMLFGLLLNNVSLSLGYETPFSTIPLLIALNLTSIVLVIIGYKLNKDLIFILPEINFSSSEKAFLIVPVSFPALSIVGTHVLNTTDNNIIMMFLLFLIAIYVVSVCIYNQKIPNRVYPVVIFLISISLLLLMALRSNHIIGSDAHMEYYFFQTTLNNLHWSILMHTTLDTALSISVLPTIFQTILNMPSELLFKVIYPIIYSVVPLIIYAVSKKYVKEFYAFLASCFFMFQQNFLFTTMNARTSIAVMFFALAMMTLFNDKIDPLKKRFLFLVLIASSIVSHYSTTYIFFLVLLGAFIGVEIASTKYHIKKVMSLTSILLFFAILFLWYAQITESAFNPGVRFIENTFSNLGRFFVEDSRDGGTQALLGKNIVQKNIPQKIEFIFTWMSFAFIGVGIITLIRRYKEMSFPELNYIKSEFLKNKFEVTYSMFALLYAVSLIAIVALPFISIGYDLGRLYAIAITILSIFFVIGGIIIAKYLDKLLVVLRGKALTQNASQVLVYLVILFVLIPYFLSVTGVMYNILGTPRAIILNSEGEQYDMYYVHDHDIYGAKWLKNNMNPENKITSDYRGANIFLSQTISRGLQNSRALFKNKKIEGYIYLRYVNVVGGKLQENVAQWQNITDYSDAFIEKGKIYDNGGSNIYG